MLFRRLLTISTLLLLPGIAVADGSFRTVLVIDASSSMRATDPQQLRKVAAELYVDLARSGDRIAVTGFDGDVRESSGGFVVIDSPAARNRVKEQITSVGDDGDWTNFNAGLSEAARLLATLPRNPGDQDLIVFLTDGKCDPGPTRDRAAAEQKCQNDVLNTWLPTVPNARVFTIGLSAAAPKGFLQELGRRSGGDGRVALKASQLPSMFADVYARLLGSRLQQGRTRTSARVQVYEGAESLDLILMGTGGQTSRLFEPDGTEVPIHNKQPNAYYFVGHKRYRLFKISKPVAGTWTLKITDGRKRTFLSLQHFNLELSLHDAPEVAEIGRPMKLQAKLATPAGTMPSAQFLDHHKMRARLQIGRKKRDVVMKRNAEGLYTAQFTPTEMGEIKVSLLLEPGPDGVLSRTMTVAKPIRVVPPLRLVAQSLSFGEVKQGEEAVGTLSLAGSDLGVDVRLRLTLDDDAADISPNKIKAKATGTRQFPIALELGKDTPPGSYTTILTLTPDKPRGFGDRAITLSVSATVIQLSFWERHGAKVGGGIGGLLGLVLLGGLMMGAKFKKRAILYYKDVRDPDMTRQSSYPLGVKATKGFYKAARIVVGPTGPVKSGGAVVLVAGPGGAILATPVASRTVLRVPDTQDDDFSSPSNEDKQEVHLANGSFRVSPAVHYEIDGAGLVFWIK